jgi:hypothetical protein
VVPECMDSAGSTTRRWRRVAGRWFNVGGGGGAPMIELGFRGGRISVDDCRGGRLGGERRSVVVGGGGADHGR